MAVSGSATAVTAVPRPLTALADQNVQKFLVPDRIDGGASVATGLLRSL
jgi:hypothetical protein